MNALLDVLFGLLDRGTATVKAFRDAVNGQRKTEVTDPKNWREEAPTKPGGRKP